MKFGKSQREKDPKKVVSIAIYRNGTLLFGKRADNGKWTQPGGHLNPGEAPEKGAVREMMEETGLKPVSLKKLGEGLLSEFNLKVYSYRAEADGTPDASQDPDEEFSTFRWVDPADVPAEILENLHSPENVTLQLLGIQEESGTIKLTRQARETLRKDEKKQLGLDLGVQPTEPKLPTAKQMAKMSPAELMSHPDPTFRSHGLKHLKELGMSPNHEERAPFEKLLSDPHPEVKADAKKYLAYRFQYAALPEEMDHWLEHPHAIDKDVMSHILREGIDSKTTEKLMKHPAYDEKIHLPLIWADPTVRHLVGDKLEDPAIINAALADPHAGGWNMLVNHQNPLVARKFIDRALMPIEQTGMDPRSRERMLTALAESQHVLPSDMEKIYDQSERLRSWVLQRPQISDSLWDRGLASKDDEQLLALARHEGAPPERLAQVFHVLAEKDKGNGFDLSYSDQAAVHHLVSRQSLSGQQLRALVEAHPNVSTSFKNQVARGLYNRSDTDTEIAKLLTDVGGIQHLEDPYSDVLKDEGVIRHAFEKGSRDHLADPTVRPRIHFALARRRSLPSDIRMALLQHPHEDVRERAENYQLADLTPEEGRHLLYHAADPKTSIQAVVHPDVPTGTFTDDQIKEALLNHPNPEVRDGLADELTRISRDRPTLVDQGLLTHLYHNGPSIKSVTAALRHPDAPNEIIEHALTPQLDGIAAPKARALLHNPKLSAANFHRLMTQPWNDPSHKTPQNRFNEVVNSFRHRTNVAPETMEYMAEHGSGSVIGDIVSRPDAPESALRRILSNPDNQYWHTAAKKNLAQHNPDEAFEQRVSFSLDTNKLRKVRDLLAASPDKPQHKNNFQKFGIDLTPYCKPGTAFVDPEKVQAAIDSKPKLNYNISHDEWDGAQRHNNEPSKVFQLNLTTDLVNQMKQAGVYDTFRHMHKVSHSSAHPVHEHHGIGWVRYTQAGDKKAGTEECEDCGGAGTRSYEREVDCGYCEGTGQDRFDCPECDGTGEGDKDCETCEGSGTGEDGARCEDCSGEGKVKEENGCENCGGDGRVQDECTECRGSGNTTEEVHDEECDNCDGTGRYTPRYARVRQNQALDPAKDAFFIDEVQSDFGQDFGKVLAINQRNQYVAEAERRGLTGAEAEAYVNRQMQQHEEELSKYPPEKTKKINEILFAGKHSNEILYEAFLQHLRDKGHAGSDVRVHSIDSKAPISLYGGANKMKWIDPKNKNKKVDIRQLPAEEQTEEALAAKGYKKVRDVPAHFLHTYENIPQKVLGWAEGKYGEIASVEDGHTREGRSDEGHDHLDGARVWGDKLRKSLVFKVSDAPEWSELEFVHLEPVEKAAKSFLDDPAYKRALALKARIAAIAAEGEKPSVWPSRFQASKVVVSKDPSKPGKWRVTHFTPEGEPSGHAEASSHVEALQTAHGYGADLLGETVKKHRGPFKFPGLGLPDDRRETPIINSRQELKTKAHAITNAWGRAENIHPDVVAREAHRLETQPPLGVASANSQAAGPSFALGSDLRNEMRPALDTSNHVIRSPKSPVATKLHEDLHMMFSRVQKKHGVAGRQNLAKNMLERLKLVDADAYLALREFMSVNYTPHYHHQTPFSHEEHLTGLLNYVNDSGARKTFYERARLNDPDVRQHFDGQMKRAHAILSETARKADPRWVLSPNEKKAADWKEIEDQAAAQDGLQKAERDNLLSDDLNVPMNFDDHHGFVPEIHPAFGAAKFLAGGHDLSLYGLRRALHRADGDYVGAALVAYGFEDTPENRDAIKHFEKIIEEQHKPGKEPTPPRGELIVGMVPASREFAEALERAYGAGQVRAARLNGKHSAGSFIARDPETQKIFLIKPGAGGPGPAQGLDEERASPARREAAFYQLAQLLGIEDVPETHLVMVDGREYAMIEMLPFNWMGLEKAYRDHPNSIRAVLAPLRHNGQLFRWSAMDFIGGNADRHGQNLMVDRETEQVGLIDHGSTFAGNSFSPGHDDNSFIPFYLRAWAGRGYADLSKDQKIKMMPTAGGRVESELSHWIDDISPEQIEHICLRYGINPQPTLTRLAKLKDLAKQMGADKALNHLWVGL